LETEHGKSGVKRKKLFASDPDVNYLPDVGDFNYMLRLLFRAWRRPGDNPLTATELATWSDRVGTPLSAWEFQTLLELADIVSGCISTYRGSTDRCPMLPPKNDGSDIKTKFAEVSAEVKAKA